MKEKNVVHNNPFDYAIAFPALSPLAINRLTNYGSRALENELMTGIDMECSQLICTRAIAAHVNVTAVAVQASELFPEAAERFRALAVKNYHCLARIIDDSSRWR